MLGVMPSPCFGFQRLRVLVIKANATDDSLPEAQAVVVWSLTRHPVPKQ
jgi:hypothetical protein